MCLFSPISAVTEALNGVGWEHRDRFAGVMSSGERRKSSEKSLWAFGGQGKCSIRVWGWGTLRLGRIQQRKPSRAESAEERF